MPQPRSQCVRARPERRPPRADGSAGPSECGALVQQGRLDEAEAQAQRALSDPATRAAAYSVLGTIRFQRKRLDDSVVSFKKAIALDDRLVGAHLSLAQVYTLQGKPALAHAAPANARWHSMRSKVPRDLMIKRRRAPGDSRRRTGGHRAARTRARRRSAVVRAGVQSRGRVPVNDDPARALERYDAALALKPDSVPALRQAAAVAEQRGELERSLSYWMRAKKIAPEDPEILLGFGRVCLRMDLLDDAEPALVKAAALKPADRTYQYTLAAAKVGKKQFEAAQHLVEPLVEKHPADAQLQYALGSILYLEGHLTEAATHLRESLRLQPEQLASQYYLGLVVRDQGNDAEAIAMPGEGAAAAFPTTRRRARLWAAC